MIRFLICLILFPLISFGQNTGLVIDTSYHSNDSINKIAQFYIDQDGNRISEGIFLLYDSTGILRRDGQHRHESEIRCIRCFEEIVSEDYIDTSWLKYEVARHNSGSIKVGLWKWYHANGNLESIGRYTGAVRESFGIHWGPEKKSVGASNSRIGA